MGIGDWGLGIGPIPNPQSPSPIYRMYTLKFEFIKKYYNKFFISIKLKYKLVY